MCLCVYKQSLGNPALSAFNKTQKDSKSPNYTKDLDVVTMTHHQRRLLSSEYHRHNHVRGTIMEQTRSDFSSLPSAPEASVRQPQPQLSSSCSSPSAESHWVEDALSGALANCCCCCCEVCTVCVCVHVAAHARGPFAEAVASRAVCGASGQWAGKDHGQ